MQEKLEMIDYKVEQKVHVAATIVYWELRINWNRSCRIKKWRRTSLASKGGLRNSELRWPQNSDKCAITCILSRTIYAHK